MITQKLILGTYTTGKDTEYLKVASVQFPGDNYDQDDGDEVNTQIQIEKQFPHDTEVNKARYQPQNPTIVATGSANGNVHLYDISKDEESGLRATLSSHKEDVWGISWNPSVANQFVTSDNLTVALWDATQVSGKGSPTKVYTDLKESITDVDFHHKNPYLFGGSSDKMTVNLYDTRQDKATESVELHDDPINSLAFSPFSEFMFATASTDRSVAIWDTRNLKHRLHSLIAHEDSITNVQWSPHVDGVLASAGVDRRVILWDICKIGEEQTPEDAEDGAPELLYMHGGHTGVVNDFGFNPLNKWYLGSVSDDNIGQIWRPSESIVGKSTTVDEIHDRELE